MIGKIKILLHVFEYSLAVRLFRMSLIMGDARKGKDFRFAVDYGPCFLSSGVPLIICAFIVGCGIHIQSQHSLRYSLSELLLVSFYMFFFNRNIQVTL